MKNVLPQQVENGLAILNESQEHWDWANIDLAYDNVRWYEMKNKVKIFTPSNELIDYMIESISNEIQEIRHNDVYDECENEIDDLKDILNTWKDLK